MKKDPDMSADWIERLIQDFIDTSPHNTMRNKTGDPAWVRSGCVTASSRPGAKPCGLDRSWPRCPSIRRRDPIATTGPIAFFSRKGPAASASSAARPVPSPKRDTTRKSVGSTWSDLVSTSKKPTSSRGMGAVCVKWGCHARPAYPSSRHGKHWSVESCPPRRRPWPDEPGYRQSTCRHLHNDQAGLTV